MKSFQPLKKLQANKIFRQGRNAAVFYLLQMES